MLSFYSQNRKQTKNTQRCWDTFQSGPSWGLPIHTQWFQSSSLPLCQLYNTKGHSKSHISFDPHNNMRVKLSGPQSQPPTINLPEKQDQNLEMLLLGWQLLSAQVGMVSRFGEVPPSEFRSHISTTSMLDGPRLTSSYTPTLSTGTFFLFLLISGVANCNWPTEIMRKARSGLQSR